MESKDLVINRTVDPFEIEERQLQKNPKPHICVIRRDWVQAGSNGPGANKAIPYWFPSGRKYMFQIERNAMIYNRTDKIYQTLLEHIPEGSKCGLEVRHDVGRSTGWLSTSTKRIDVLCDQVDLDWITIYDANARGISKALKSKLKTSIKWMFGNKWPNKQYDWIKLEVDRVGIDVDQAIQHLKPEGILFCIGTMEQCQKWLDSKWAKKLTLDYQYSYSSTSKNSFLCFSINTNGE